MVHDGGGGGVLYGDLLDMETGWLNKQSGMSIITGSFSGGVGVGVGGVDGIGIVCV